MDSLGWQQQPVDYFQKREQKVVLEEHSVALLRRKYVVHNRVDELRPHIHGCAVWSDAVLHFFRSLLKLCCSRLSWVRQSSHWRLWGLFCVLAVRWETQWFSVMCCDFYFVVDLFPLSSYGGVLLTPSLCSNGLWETDSEYRSEPLNLS